MRAPIALKRIGKARAKAVLVVALIAAVAAVAAASAATGAAAAKRAASTGPAPFGRSLAAATVFPSSGTASTTLANGAVIGYSVLYVSSTTTLEFTLTAGHATGCGHVVADVFQLDEDTPLLELNAGVDPSTATSDDPTPDDNDSTDQGPLAVTAGQPYYVRVATSCSAAPLTLSVSPASALAGAPAPTAACRAAVLDKAAAQRGIGRALRAERSSNAAARRAARHSYATERTALGRADTKVTHDCPGAPVDPLF